MTWLWLAACPLSREPTVEERSLALTAADLAPVAIKRVDVDRRNERWSVSRAAEGWSLEYDFQQGPLAVHYRAIRAADRGQAEITFASFSLGVGQLQRIGGVELGEPLSLGWGERSECRAVAVSGHDMGFVCQGLDGDRLFTASVYGVSPHGAGAPAPLLRPPLAALERWDP